METSDWSIFDALPFAQIKIFIKYDPFLQDLEKIKGLGIG